MPHELLRFHWNSYFIHITMTDHVISFECYTHLPFFAHKFIHMSRSRSISWNFSNENMCIIHVICESQISKYHHEFYVKNKKHSSAFFHSYNQPSSGKQCLYSTQFSQNRPTKLFQKNIKWFNIDICNSKNCVNINMVHTHTLMYQYGNVFIEQLNQISFCLVNCASSVCGCVCVYDAERERAQKINLQSNSIRASVPWKNQVFCAPFSVELIVKLLFVLVPFFFLLLNFNTTGIYSHWMLKPRAWIKNCNLNVEILIKNRNVWFKRRQCVY